MATDYDAPLRTESDDVTEDSLEELKERPNDTAASILDVDETDTAEFTSGQEQLSSATTPPPTPRCCLTQVQITTG